MRDLETSRMGAPYIYDISRLRVKSLLLPIKFSSKNWIHMHIGTQITDGNRNLSLPNFTCATGLLSLSTQSWLPGLKKKKEKKGGS